MDYNEYTVDENVGGIGFILRDRAGEVVREQHEVPVGFLTRKEGETWLKMAAMRQAKVERLRIAIEEEQGL